MKNYKIKYMTGIKHEDGITVPIYKYKSIPCRSTRRYHGSMYALAGLAACPRDLLDYLCERMDSNNIVFSNAKVRDNFKDIIYNVSGYETVYQDATIKRAFYALVNKNLLLKGDKRGTYIVNPLYYSKNENKERIQLIENLVREDLLKFKQ
tara:strand:+ start:3677 stop:4129 length:453 start_codon:yes stop_codon:yes gene_type:complete